MTWLRFSVLDQKGKIVLYILGWVENLNIKRKNLKKFIYLLIQLVIVVEPSPDVDCKSGQSKQRVWPRVGWYDPFGHGWHGSTPLLE